MTLIDGFIVAVLVAAAVRGAVRGFVAEMFGVLALGCGAAGALAFAPSFTQMAGQRLALETPVLVLVGFIAAFFSVYVPVLLIGSIAGRFWLRGVVGALNRLGGAALGTLKWAFALALLLAGTAVVGGQVELPGRADSRLAGMLEQALTVPWRIDSRSGTAGEG